MKACETGSETSFDVYCLLDIHPGVYNVLQDEIPVRMHVRFQQRPQVRHGEVASRIQFSKKPLPGHEYSLEIEKLALGIMDRNDKARAEGLGIHRLHSVIHFFRRLR